MSEIPREKSLLVFLFIAFVFLASKLIFLAVYNYMPLAGDAPGFVHMAENMKSFYACSTREPFWILWVKIWISFFRNPATGVRVSCILLYVFSSYFVFLILEKSLGGPSALAGSFFYLLTPYMFFSHIRAHRLELYLFLLLLFCFWILFKMDSNLNAIFSGVIVSALILTRMEALLIVFLGFLFYLIFSKSVFRDKITKIFISCAVLLILSGPFFLSCLVKKGSVFYVLNVHSRFWDSHEHAGQPGFRRPEVVLKKPYEGRHVTVLKYIFSGRSPLKLISRVAGGYVKTLTRGVKHMLSIPVSLSFLLYFVWLGFIVMLFSKTGKTLLFWGMLFILPHSFILNLHVVGKPSVDIRFAASAVPLMAFSFACLVFAVLNYARGFGNKKEIDMINEDASSL
ncbi:MAG: glycosyltransferase family 39 protein [Elusimicrobia bacterium]|nr:glycosyltransferase family 39 protein [Elusimicrobiota bacterium]